MARRLATAAIAAGLVAVAATAAGCGSGGSGDANTIKIAYQKFGNFIQGDALFKKVKVEWEKANPGKKVTLVPIQGNDADYKTKLSLMQKSPSTAPDVLYEDTFTIASDVQAGYLAPLDTYVGKWADWSQFVASSKGSVTGQDGKVYGIPMGTDTRALWYNKQIFAKAGLPADWQPKTWNDLLTAARTIKSKVPGVIPLNVYVGKAGGEQSSMQGHEMLLYGTANKLYDDKTKKWLAPSKGFTDSLNFVKTVYGEGLGPTPQQALSPSIGTQVGGTMLPQGKLAIDLDGSWMPQTWIASGASPWPQWSQVMGTAAMPTQNGEAPGKVSMSGGWTLAVGNKSTKKDLAFSFISTALNKENSLYYDINATQIPVRTDVASDPTYGKGDPTAKFFASLVPITNYRPALPPYPQISNEIQVAQEAVVSGQATPDAATSTFANAVKGIVGPNAVAAG
jgi:multiple sugar transport system substrate-binding protein